jgi:hypothetical protein
MLEALSRRVHDELALFEYPLKDWVVPVRGPAGEYVHNVVIVGGGQTGLGTAFGLQRERAGCRTGRGGRTVGHLRTHDHAADAEVPDRAGSWRAKPDFSSLA